MPKISRTKEMIQLPEDFVPRSTDVICAKGKLAKEHRGNQMLRYLVESNLQEYSECPSKLERSFIVSRILKTIRESGGFIRQVGGKWHEVGDRNAREKIGQIFRDRLSHMFKSSTRAKASVRRHRASCTVSASSGSSVSSSTCRSSQQESSATRVLPKSTPIASFPITEVSFAPEIVTPDFSAKPQVKVDLNNFEVDFYNYNLEPLPLSQALVMDMDCLHMSGLSNDFSFDEAIDEMFQSQSFSF